MASIVNLEAAATRIATSAVVTALDQQAASHSSSSPDNGSKRARVASDGPVDDAESIALWRAEIRDRLARPLDINMVASRTGPGNTKLFYLPSDAVIKLANDIFGSDGWSCDLRSVKIDFIHRKGNVVEACATAHMRVTLKDGTFHEDIGCGDCKAQVTDAAAIQKAKKQAVTDARKRCLRLFHDKLGNCLRDQAFIRALKKQNTDKALAVAAARAKERAAQQAGAAGVPFQATSTARGRPPIVVAASTAAGGAGSSSTLAAGPHAAVPVRVPMSAVTPAASSSSSSHRPSTARSGPSSSTAARPTASLGRTVYRSDHPPAISERFDAATLMGAAPNAVSTTTPRTTTSSSSSSSSSSVPAVIASFGDAQDPHEMQPGAGNDPGAEEAEALAALASYEADEAADRADVLGSPVSQGLSSSSAVRAALVSAEEAVSGDQDDDIDAEMLALTAGMLPHSQEAPDFAAAAQATVKPPTSRAIRASANVLQASDASNDSLAASQHDQRSGSRSDQSPSALSANKDATGATAADRAASNRARALRLRQQRQQVCT